MLTYIKNILPRLQKFSTQLDKTENFVGKRWLLIDEASNGHSYEFLRDGRLVMSIVTNGVDQETKIGKWELLPSARLLVHRPEPLVLESAFFGDGLIVFKISGTTNTPFSLYDPGIIIDGNVEAYLNKYLQVKEAARITSSTEHDDFGRKILRNPDGSLFNGEIIDPNNKSHYIIFSDGIETGFYYATSYGTDRGNVIIKTNRDYYSVSPVKGNFVLNEDGTAAPDGFYKFTPNEFELISMEVSNGKVEKVVEDEVFRKIVIAIGGIILFLLILGVIAATR